jgi:hypothetical protein
VSCSVLWMKSRISSRLFISILRLVVFCLRNIRPSDVQYVYSKPLYFSSASCFTSSVRYLVRFSVMKILSVWFFRPFLLLYTLLRVLYEMNFTITWDFPSFTFLIIRHDEWALYLWTLYRCCFSFFYFFAFVYVYTIKVSCTPVELFSQTDTFVEFLLID